MLTLAISMHYFIRTQRFTYIFADVDLVLRNKADD